MVAQWVPLDGGNSSTGASEPTVCISIDGLGWWCYSPNHGGLGDFLFV